jgi:hypothetical protein
MKVAPRIVVPALIASLIFGFFAQELLMADGMGFNMAILCLALLGAVLFLRKSKAIEPSFNIWYLIVPVLVAVYGFAVPSSRGLATLNTIMILMSLGYCAIRCASGKALTLVESLGKVPAAFIGFGFAGAMLAFLADWEKAPKIGKLNIGRGAFIGCIAAIPFLAAFGSVLAQADPMFGRLFAVNLDANPDVFMPRLLIFMTASASLGGILIYFSPAMFNRMNVAIGIRPDPNVPPRATYVSSMPPSPMAEATPVASRESEYVAIFVTFFGLIAALFFLFMMVQVRYLFGGDSVVLQTAHLTYADYARRGFMEIVGVSAICLPLLIFSQNALKGFDPKLRKAVNIVMVIIVGLLFLLLASATFRLKLYVGAYGLSPLRVYVGAGMVWLFVLFATYLRYGLKWKLDPIGRFVYASMVMITLGLNLVRPDYWIARVNLTRKEAKNIDPSMILEAGADAQSAIRGFGGARIKDPTSGNDLLTAYLKNQNAAPHGWKEMTISQMLARRN